MAGATAMARSFAAGRGMPIISFFRARDRGCSRRGRGARVPGRYNDHDEHHGPETGRQSRPRERPCAEYDDERRKDEFSEQTLAKPRFLTHERSPPLLTI